MRAVFSNAPCLDQDHSKVKISLSSYPQGPYLAICDLKSLHSRMNNYMINVACSLVLLKANESAESRDQQNEAVKIEIMHCRQSKILLAQCC